MTPHVPPVDFPPLEAEAAKLDDTAYLLTVTGDRKPHCSVAAPGWDPQAGRLRVAAPVPTAGVPGWRGRPLSPSGRCAPAEGQRLVPRGGARRTHFDVPLGAVAHQPPTRENALFI